MNDPLDDTILAWKFAEEEARREQCRGRPGLRQSEALTRLCHSAATLLDVACALLATVLVFLLGGTLGALGALALTIQRVCG